MRLVGGMDTGHQRLRRKFTKISRKKNKKSNHSDLVKKSSPYYLK